MKIIYFLSIKILTITLIAMAYVVPANAVVMNFDGLETSPFGGKAFVIPYSENGLAISITEGANMYAYGEGWQSGRGTSNGSTVVGLLGDGAELTLSAVGNKLFSFVSIDLAEFFLVDDWAAVDRAKDVFFLGNFDGGGTISLAVTLDTLGDGPGGIDDFETVLFSSLWANLSSVKISALPVGAYLSLDNITANINSVSAVPVPAALPLFGTGLALLGFMGWRRKRKAA